MNFSSNKYYYNNYATQHLTDPNKIEIDSIGALPDHKNNQLCDLFQPHGGLSKP